MYWIILFLFILFLYFNLKIKETFNNFFSPSRVEYPTRNMSYDLRGEAYFPSRTNFPFDNSEIGPIHQRYTSLHKNKLIEDCC
jgi:hypothetical protein